MTSSFDAPRGMTTAAARHVAWVAVVALAAGLAACGDRKAKPASQVAAKVNKEEISVHQINFVLQQQRGLRPEKADAAGKQILERLIDQELALQKAQELKVDRDPRVVQQIEAARREIVARAYVEKVGEGVAKPSAEEIKKYYDDKPALFRERRIYSIQEVAIEARPEQVAALRTQLQGAKNINQFMDYLKANNYRFAANQAVRPAEQLPLNMLDTFAQLRDGQAMLVPTPAGAQVVVLAGSRNEPIDEARARPAIEQFLINDAKRKLVETDMKAMRTAAKIEYVGKFAEGAASAPAAEASASQPAAPVAVSPAPQGGASGIDASVMNKGLSGLK
jgi:EpsD family peptidyl-prolyl cis-trans isomerase